MFAGGWVLAVAAARASTTRCRSSARCVDRGRRSSGCFIIFHDCGHGSFSRSRRLNDVVGTMLGVLVFTPFRHWNYAHVMHHATSSDLDRRGRRRRVDDDGRGVPPRLAVAGARYYRAYHSPVGHVHGRSGDQVRSSSSGWSPCPTRHRRRITRSVHVTNVGHRRVRRRDGGARRAAARTWPCRCRPSSSAARVRSGCSTCSTASRARTGRAASDWRYVDAAMRGSSHLRLGRVLQYVSGNIGFHHLHHLDARIPNYNLPRCCPGAPRAAGRAQLHVARELRRPPPQAVGRARRPLRRLRGRGSMTLGRAARRRPRPARPVPGGAARRQRAAVPGGGGRAAARGAGYSTPASSSPARSAGTSGR